MAYMYDMLKNAIGGFNLSSSNNTIKNWSPNSIKALVISRNCIVVVYHLKPVKLVNLDLNEVSADISNARGAMHNLLTQRQLSCLEEILVDSLFKNYRNLLDLDGYVSKLLSDKSRLRYYGYIGKVDTAEVLRKYTIAQRNDDVAYSYCCDKDRHSEVWYTSVNNRNWYKVYNLRPQYYALDSDNGALHRWFTHCENKIEELQSKEKEVSEVQSRLKAINTLFEQDMTYVKEVSYVSKLLRRVSNSGDEVRRVVYSVLVDAIRGSVTRKVSEKELVQAIKTTNTLDAKFMLSIYKAHGVIADEKAKEHTESETLYGMSRVGTGFLNMPNTLDYACCQVYEELNSKGNAYIFLLATAFSQVYTRLANGQFRRTFNLSYEIMGEVKAYVEYLCLVAGVDWNEISGERGDK